MEKKDFNLLTKESTFRKTFAEKRELVKSLEDALANLEYRVILHFGSNLLIILHPLWN